MNKQKECIGIDCAWCTEDCNEFNNQEQAKIKANTEAVEVTKCEYSKNGVCNRYSTKTNIIPCYGDATCDYKQLQQQTKRADEAEKELTQYKSLYRQFLQSHNNPNMTSSDLDYIVKGIKYIAERDLIVENAKYYTKLSQANEKLEKARKFIENQGFTQWDEKEVQQLLKELG